MNYNLERFIKAQEKDYNKALSEIKQGKKQSHWIWYIFPQLKELGHSSTAQYYGIKDEEEARQYFQNTLLKDHLIEITKELYKQNNNIKKILGYPDYLKVKSCMTLFSYIDPTIDIFQKVIDKFYHGNKDEITINLLKKKQIN